MGAGAVIRQASSRRERAHHINWGEAMLIQLIYRSRSIHAFGADELRQLGAELTARNQGLQVSGLLLYDGAYFLQVLEGDEARVDGVYAAVLNDARHTDIVLLLRDPIPRSHFEGFQMTTLDVRTAQDPAAGAATAGGRSLRLARNRDHRSERIIEAFVHGRWRDPVPAVAWASDIGLPDSGMPDTPCTATTVAPVHLADLRQARFALQPIVHPLSRRITSVEALLRGARGESAQQVLAAIAPSQLHAFDLHSKGDAIALAAALRLNCVLSVNLLPMSLVSNDHAVDYLVEQCRRYQWPTEHLQVEVTEEEAITHWDDFMHAVRQLRAAGIQVAIDDFGAGHAGLTLLADFQPDKLKLDKRIVQGVASHGPRQAIVRSTIEFCFCLGITVVAEGVETVEDWWWLQSAGVRRFQGYLFARPQLQGTAQVAWPVAPGLQAQRLAA